MAAAASLVLVPPAGAAQLRRLDAEPVVGGAAARLLLSSPVRARVRDVPGEPGTVLRLYVDLPAGTRLAPGVARRAPAVSPIAGLRVGAGEKGSLRVVVELEGAATYQVTRSDGGRVLTVAVTPVARGAPAADSAGPGRPAAVPAIATGTDMPRPSSRSRPRIVLDPGHGGGDPGARGFAVEKDVTLAVARRLAELLRERADADVVLTRTRDATLPLAARTARANAEGADLFVSIHANAATSRDLRGVETYYLNNTDDRAAIRLAAMENGVRAPARARGRTDLRYILSSLVQVGKMEESIALAEAVQRGLVGHLRSRYEDVVDLGVKQGPFYVLVGAHMPCVLVETSFLSHPREGRRLASRAYREALAEGIYHGVARFLDDARRARTL
jgi:N-acetylmuramoyl-L-alanine amidase